MLGFGEGTIQLSQMYPGTVIYISYNNPSQFYGPVDMAVIKFEKLPSNISPLQLAAPNEIYIGQTAQNVGWAGLQRKRGICNIRNIIGNYILTDCPSDNGDSGGPLLVLTRSGQWKVAGIDHSGKVNADGSEISGLQYTDANSEQYSNITNLGWNVVSGI
jgi:hypothetical protein